MVVFQDIEQRCRHLVDTAKAAPVLAQRGWTTREDAASDLLQHLAAHRGLTEPADYPHATAPPHTAGEPATPAFPAHLARRAADRAATRARCTAGIRCTEPTCLTYGAVQVTGASATWLCTNCIPAVNARLAARGSRPDPVRPVPHGTPDNGPYRVTLYNATGNGVRTVHCDTPQRAQFIAETERPYNNTGYTISLGHLTGES